MFAFIHITDLYGGGGIRNEHRVFSIIEQRYDGGS
jgi:hypothetical protein